MTALFTRRAALLGAGLCLQEARASIPLKHFKVDGEWCFLGMQARPNNGDRAVILFDGNGTTVGADTSSWEKNAACTALSQAILDAGIPVAQSNRTATPENGMWGNAASQRSILALMELLRKDHGIRRFSAITVSAGGASLLNLLLDHKASFDAAAVFAPAISLKSMYRCPGGIDRVKGIAEAYRFKPLTGCPGDPEKDLEFRRATEGFDPIRRIGSALPKDWAGSKTSWMVLYHHGDPKVLPLENGGRLVQLLRQSGAQVREVAIEGQTHNSEDLMRDYGQDVVRLLMD